MVDNVTADPGTGGATFGSDEIGGVHYPRTKIIFGADGVNAGDVATGNPLPIEVRTPAGDSAMDDTADAVRAILQANSGVDIGDVTINNASLTVDNTTLDNAHASDFDTGGGVDTTPAFGIAVPASGGAAVVPGDATAGLKVNLGSDNDVVVSGAVTANAGTNLNTSALALESGGNLATLAGAVSGTEMQVDIVSGAVTANAGTNLNTSALALESGGNLATLAGAVSGTEVQVDVVGALPAGGNTIGTVTVQDGGNSITVDGAHIAAEGAALGSGVLIQGDDGTDRQNIQLSAAGDLKVTLDSETVLLGANSGVDIGDVTLNNGFASVTGGGTEASALRVTLASNSTGVLSVDDNGGSLTVDNATLSDAHSEDFDTGGGTDTTPAFGIAVPASGGAAVVPGSASDGLLVNLGANNDVSVSGTVTANLSATDNAVLDAIQVAVETIDNAIVGSEMQVDVVASLPAGDNNIGNVDVVSIVPGTAATNLGKAEDAPHSSGDVGVAAMSVRQNTAAALGGTDGDYQPLITDANGRLHSIDVGIQAALSGSELQVDVVGALPAGTNNIGDVDVLSFPQADSHYRNIDANAEAAIKASAGTLFWIHAINLTSAVAYLHLYDATTANVTPGTTTPDFTFPIPAQSDGNGAGFNLAFGAAGHSFANAITLVVTTTTNGAAGDPGTNGVMVNAGYS